MEQLLSLLLAIPSAFWAALVASALTLAGVYASNRSNTTGLRIQLEHDSAEKARERTASLRKDAYLTAAEELAKVGMYLGGLAQVDIAKANPASGLQDFAAAAARLQLVAEPRTALLVNALAAAYTETLLRLVPRLIPINVARAAIGTHDELYNQAHTEVRRVLAEMSRFNEAATVNDGVFAALRRSFDGFQKQAQGQAEERARAWAALNASTLTFAQELLVEQRELLKQQIPILVAIRNDLGLTTDIEAFEKQVQEQWVRMAAQADRTLSLLKLANPSIEATDSSALRAHESAPHVER